MQPSLVIRRDALALILAAASWGLGTVISKRALDEIAPLALLPIQLAASLVVLTLVMRVRGVPLRDPDASPLLGRLGLLNPGLAYALSLVGLVSISASLSVLLWAIEPVLILLLAALVLRERITPALAVLSALALGGIVLVVFDPLSSGQVEGVALTVAGVVCCAAYTVLTRRWIATSDSTAQVVVAQQAWALLFSSVVVVLAAVLGSAGVPARLTAAGLGAAVASGVLYYAAAYWFYLTGLRGLPASTAAASFYLIPVFGVAAGGLFLSEVLAPRQWLGAVVAIAAVAIILRRSRPAAAPAAPAVEATGSPSVVGP
jgi:drug/metabolite transporter (DMT)-like permease